MRVYTRIWCNQRPCWRRFILVRRVYIYFTLPNSRDVVPYVPSFGQTDLFSGSAARLASFEIAISQPDKAALRAVQAIRSAIGHGQELSESLCRYTSLEEFWDVLAVSLRT
jgi:hypothetical protein